MAPRMQTNRKGFGAGRLGEAGGIGDGQALPRLDHQPVTEQPLLMGKPHGRPAKPHGQAMDRQALVAILAGAARPAGVDRHACAGNKTGHIRANLHNGARGFMPQDHRLFQADRTEPAIVVIMQIRPTDPAHRQGNHHLAGPRTFRSLGFNSQIPLAVNPADATIHAILPPPNSGISMHHSRRPRRARRQTTHDRPTPDQRPVALQRSVISSWPKYPGGSASGAGGSAPNPATERADA